MTNDELVEINVSELMKGISLTPGESIELVYDGEKFVESYGILEAETIGDE